MRWITVLSFAILALVGSPALAVSPWIVFFESNSDRLTPQSVVVIDNVAVSFRAVGIRGFELFGHTDRAGDTHANLRLSHRRAEAVRAALIRRGIPAEVITVNSMGKERPIVETEDGVAERQNRRVEIVITCIENPDSGFDYMRCDR